MKRHHVLIAIGTVLFLAAWLSWSTLLVESELTAPQAEAPTVN